MVDDVRFTTVHMALVRTPMISPTTFFIFVMSIIAGFQGGHQPGQGLLGDISDVSCFSPR